MKGFLIIIVFVAVLILLAASGVHAQDCDAFNLDGGVSKWVGVDKAPMYEAGKVGHDHVGYFYRHTCGGYDNIAVILFPPHEIDPNAQRDDHWIRRDSKTGEKLLQMGDPTFVWLVGAEGWEGKFPAVDAVLIAHTTYGNGQTARNAETPTAVTLAAFEAEAAQPVRTWLLLPVAALLLVVAFAMLGDRR